MSFAAGANTVFSITIITIITHVGLAKTEVKSDIHSRNSKSLLFRTLIPPIDCSRKTTTRGKSSDLLFRLWMSDLTSVFG